MHTRGNAILVVLAVVALAGALGFFLLRGGSRSAPDTDTTSPIQQTVDGKTYTFDNPIKSAHYESNTPEHAVALAGVPINVVLDFNFDLAPPSSISIKSGGDEYGTGETVIDANKLAMRRAIDPSAPDGIYTVEYNACWPDSSCDAGMFQFAIDKTRSENFEDMTGKSEVEVDLTDIMFKPKDIKVSVGTKVTWINTEKATHYVNTDSHPAHTYQPDMNSAELAQGDSYSYTFDQAGIFPYHCSRHASSMHGIILVE